MIKKILLGLTVIAFAGAGVAIAQQSGIKRTPLQKLDFPAGYNTVTGDRGSAGGRQPPAATPIPASKPAMCSKAKLELIIDGKPAHEDQGRRILPDPGRRRSRRQGRRQTLQSARGLCRQGRQAAGQAGAIDRNHMASSRPVRATSGAGGPDIFGPPMADFLIAGNLSGAMRGTVRKITLPRRLVADLMHASIRVPFVSLARPLNDPQPFGGPRAGRATAGLGGDLRQGVRAGRQGRAGAAHALRQMAMARVL